MGGGEGSRQPGQLGRTLPCLVGWGGATGRAKATSTKPPFQGRGAPLYSPLPPPEGAPCPADPVLGNGPREGPIRGWKRGKAPDKPQARVCSPLPSPHPPYSTVAARSSQVRPRYFARFFTGLAQEARPGPLPGSPSAEKGALAMARRRKIAAPGGYPRAVLEGEGEGYLLQPGTPPPPRAPAPLPSFCSGLGVASGGLG